MTLQRVLEPEIMDSAEAAADYDAMDHREVNARFVTDLLPHLPPAGSPDSADPFPDVLDLGTGTALIPIELCRRHRDCRIMAADAAVQMLELARYNLEIENLTHRIQLAHVDAKRLPFADGMFDVVISNSIIHHIPKPIEALREALRVAAAGGVLFFRDLLRPESEQELLSLVSTYAASANERQQRLFAESLHAALTLAEIRGLIAELSFPPASVEQTSDRHWTWVARKGNRY